MTLNEFIVENKGRIGSHAYVEEPGFDVLYVRFSTRLFDREMKRTFDIARVEASEKGTGAFRGLVSWLRAKMPKVVLFVECVQVPRFAEGLVRMGFKPHASDPTSFYLG